MKYTELKTITPYVETRKRNKIKDKLVKININDNALSKEFIHLKIIMTSYYNLVEMNKRNKMKENPGKS